MCFALPPPPHTSIDKKTLKSGHPSHHNCHYLLFLKNLEKLHDSFCFSLDLERPDDFLLWDYVAVPFIENISFLSRYWTL